MATITLTVPDVALPLITEVLTSEGWDGTVPSFDLAIQQIFIRFFKDKAIQLRYKQNAESARLVGEAAITETEIAFTPPP